MKHILTAFLSLAILASAQTGHTNANLDGLNAAAAKANLNTIGIFSDTNAPEWADIASKPTTLAGMGITNGMISTPAVWVTFADGTRTAYVPAADTNAARGDAFEAAHAAALAATGKERITLFPGKFLADKATSTISGIVGQFALENGMTIDLNGAEIYKVSTDTASCLFVASATTGVGDVTILGPGILTGSYAATSDTSARGSAANELCFNFTACRRVKVVGVVGRNFAGVGIQGNSSSFPTDEYGGSSAKYSTLQIDHCNFDLNNTGLLAVAGNEYWQISNSTFNKNVSGLDIYGGNFDISGGQACGNTTHGIRLRNTGGNNAHGSWTGGKICHNADRAVYMEGTNKGFNFVGVVFGADSSTTNKIESIGGGLILSGCYVESPFYAASTPSGLNFMHGCFIAGTYTTVTDLSSAERLQWVFDDTNHTLTGGWAQNDVMIYSFADDSAAGTGGMTAGRKYRNSSTNAVAVKQ